MALMQGLVQKRVVRNLVAHYGQVIVDDCSCIRRSRVAELADCDEAAADLDIADALHWLT